VGKFLLRWALYTLLAPLAIAAIVAAVWFGVVLVIYLHEEFGKWFWLSVLLVFTAVLAAPQEATKPTPATPTGDGCRARLAPGQHWSFCGETDMGQTLPALCTNCGGSFTPAPPDGGAEVSVTSINAPQTPQG
jgi:hypothetical protein